MQTNAEFSTWFFYALSVLFGLALIYFIARYLNSLDKTIKEFKDQMIHFQVTQAVHHERITRIERWDTDVITEIMEKAMNSAVENLKKKPRA